MSMESQKWLDENVLVGMCAERGKAWHARKGTDNHFDGPVPAERLDRLFSWDAVEEPLFVMRNGETIEVPNRKAILRSDNDHVMGIHGADYEIHQFRAELIDRNKDLFDDDNLVVGSAGLLRGGARGWIQIEMPDSISVDGMGEAFRPALLTATSHDGSLATIRKWIITRVVCDNTLSMALSEGGLEHKVRHSKKSQNKLNDAREALGIIHNIADTFTQSIMAMCQTEVTDQQWSEFVKEFYPVADDAKPAAVTRAENNREALTEFYRTDERVSPWKGTKWGVIQSVNTFWTHEANVHKGTERQERNTEAVISGKMEDMDVKALSTINKVLAHA